MDWTNYENMDPDLLVGIVNTALRNHYDSLEDLCRSNNLDPEKLSQRLSLGDYEYIEAAKQFR